MGRFLNADAVYDTDAGLQGYNIFIYCGNNPVNRIDISGADSVDLNGSGEDMLDDTVLEHGGKGGTNYSHGSSTGNSSSTYNGGNNSGYSQAPPKGAPGSTYTQLTSDGTNSIKSQTTYNEYELPDCRIDYLGRSHNGIPTPHIHLYSYVVINGHVFPNGRGTVLPYYVID